MFLHLSVGHSVHGGKGSPCQRPPWTETPLDRDSLYGNERVARILLECILVNFTSYERDNRKIEKPGEENSIQKDVNQYTKAQLALQSQTVKSIYQGSLENDT